MHLHWHGRRSNFADRSRRNIVLEKGRVDELEGRRDIDRGGVVEWSIVVRQMGGIIGVI